MFGNIPKLRLGQINRIPIKIDLTFLLIPYILYSALNGRPVADHWPLIATISAGLFVSVLLHELGHGLTAQRYRVPVTEIVVGGLYGYAHMKLKAISRLRAIAILAAGPFANLAIFLVLWIALAAPPLSEIGVAGIRWPRDSSAAWITEAGRVIAMLNLVMFVFNLFPVFPLDGGKIFGLTLNRVLSIKASLLIVTVISLAFGALLVFYGFGASWILALIGIMIIMPNVSRLGFARQN